MTRPILPPVVEAVMPFRSACGLCGGPDARHRVLDAIQERVSVDEDQEVQEDYGLSAEVVEYIAEHWNGDDETWTATL